MGRDRRLPPGAAVRAADRWGYALAFALFRLFDIWKPFPIAWFDARVRGGFGVMLDDVLAAGYTILVLLGVTAWTT